MKKHLGYTKVISAVLELMYVFSSLCKSFTYEKRIMWLVRKITFIVFYSVLLPLTHNCSIKTDMMRSEYFDENCAIHRSLT